jgi:hypothetical protein
LEENPRDEHLMCSSLRSLLVNLASMVAGFRAASVYREGGTYNGR